MCYHTLVLRLRAAPRKSRYYFKYSFKYNLLAKTNKNIFAVVTPLRHGGLKAAGYRKTGGIDNKRQINGPSRLVYDMILVIK